jgi:hypothetical protein
MEMQIIDSGTLYNPIPNMVCCIACYAGEHMFFVCLFHVLNLFQYSYSFAGQWNGTAMAVFGDGD